MDINHILTVLTAPDDCKELIRALACELDTQRKLHVTMAREIERKDASYTELANNAHTLRVERDTALERLAALEGAVKRQAEKPALPEPGSSLDELLRYAAASQTEVRVTLMTAYGSRGATREGVPVWDSYGDDDDCPWNVDDWYCGIDAQSVHDRIIAVELL